MDQKDWVVLDVETRVGPQIVETAGLVQIVGRGGVGPYVQLEDDFLRHKIHDCNASINLTDEYHSGLVTPLQLVDHYYWFSSGESDERIHFDFLPDDFFGAANGDPSDDSHLV